MKFVIATLLTITALNVFAEDIPVNSCESYDVSLNSVYSMKTYGNSTIKVFEIDMIEPAAAPMGVAIAINRGDDLSNMESFCRYVPGLSAVNVTGAKSKYDKATGNLTLTLLASQTDEDGVAQSKVLTILVNKGSNSEADLVKASLK